jgi:ATP-dependent DNA helicase RecG
MQNSLVETQNIDKKSLKQVTGHTADWDELAKDCVCFANAAGGKILIGIEDDDFRPPKGQAISDKNLPEKIVKAINHRTVNTAVAAVVMVAESGDEYIELQVFRNAQTIASTTDGKYYIRVSDECRPIPPDEMARLAADKNAFVWEEQVTKRVPRSRIDVEKKDQLINDIRNSQRVSKFVREKTEDELLEYYFLANGEYFTNLGILWIGQRQDRAGLLFAPSVQVIRYNEKQEKVWKVTFDDYSLNPKELLQSTMTDIPDWQESIEISDGIFRKNIPFIPIEVVSVNSGKTDPHSPFQIDPLKIDFKKVLKKAC